MIKLLLKLFIRNSEDTESALVRERYCVLSGVLGIICNIFLFIVKILAGTAIGSIAVISDAFNNLSDMGASLVSIIGARLSNMKPDKEHPFGHGRIEYISSLIVSFIIFFVGFELIKSSISKLFYPENISYNPVIISALVLSMIVKLWMFGYNRYLGKRINSGILKAAAKDSINDVFVTASVVISMVVGKAVNIPSFDGMAGIFVSILIIYLGFGIARDTIGILLGTTPPKEVIEKIQERIMTTDGIVGMHDLVVHDYGSGRVLASVHAEVPDDYSFVKIHEIIDGLERQIWDDHGISIVIHMDPISVDCERTSKTKEIVINTVKELDERMEIHDFRMTGGSEKINLIFDVEVPSDYDDVEKIAEIIEKKMKEIDKRYTVLVNIDTLYI